MAILPTLVCALREARVIPAIVGVIIIMLIGAYCAYEAALLMQADLDIYKTVVFLLIVLLAEYMCRNLNEFVLIKFIMTPFELTVEKILLNEILKRSPSSLILFREKMNGIKNAAIEALIHLVKNTISIMNPIVLLISRGAALSTKLDVMHLIVLIASLFSVLGLGYIITAYDHKQSQKLSKIKIDADEKGRSLMTSIPTLVINGLGKRLGSWMESIRRHEIEPTTRHNCIMILLYGLLEIATIGLPVAVVWILKTEGTFLSLYIIVQPMYWNSWWLFFTVKSIVVSTAPWSQYEEFLKTTKLISTTQGIPDSAKDMIPIFEDSEIAEIKLIGDSGCGKTTLMRKLISDICDKFRQGYILYIEQYAFIPSGLSILEYFQSAFPQNFVPENLKEELLRRADMLGISNIVNDTTLSNPFADPSGGERKRIIFLQGVLPILMNASSVEIAFLDEVSAGLDEQSFSKVRDMIEELKTTDVKVVSIDHHKFVSDSIKEVEVFKKVVSVPPKSKPKVLSLWQKMKARFFPHVYVKEEDDKDLESGEVPTDVVVWAPDLGMEEPQLPV